MAACWRVLFGIALFVLRNKKRAPVMKKGQTVNSDPLLFSDNNKSIYDNKGSQHGGTPEHNSHACLTTPAGGGPYDKSCIDQAFSVKMAGYWVVLSCIFIDQDEVKLGQYGIVLTSRLVNNSYLSH